MPLVVTIFVEIIFSGTGSGGGPDRSDGAELDSEINASGLKNKRSEEFLDQIKMSKFDNNF